MAYPNWLRLVMAKDTKAINEGGRFLLFELSNQNLNWDTALARP
ncbi:hypothetical protein [Peijinzhouia sedimentorum]